MHSLGIVQWNFTRRDHPGNPGRVSGSGPVMVSASGVSVDPEKVEAVMSWERPKSVFEIHSFLGLAGYYRRFIVDFSRLAAPMTKLTLEGG